MAEKRVCMKAEQMGSHLAVQMAELKAAKWARCSVARRVQKKADLWDEN